MVRKSAIFYTVLFFLLIFTKTAVAAPPQFLEVSFECEPLFDLRNFSPGQTESRWLEIRNSSLANRLVLLKILPREGVQLSSFLEISLRRDGDELQRGLLAHLSSEKSIPLFSLEAGETAHLEADVTFLSFANNNLQNQVVSFDLVFGYQEANHLLISEVYYQVSGKKGWDSPKDRLHNLSAWEGVCLNSSPSGWWFLWLKKNCPLIIRSNEWVEFYNPTDTRQYIGGWKLEDNSGQTILPKVSIGSGKHLVITKDITTRAFWPLAWRSHFSFTNSQIGDGLGNRGDHLFLKNEVGEIVDAVGWGNDTAVWNPSPSTVPLGASLARKNKDWDSDLAEDFSAQSLPSPGY